MDDAQFQDLVDRHGGDIATWPVPLRARAQALLGNSATAREIIMRERSLKAAFADEPEIRAPEGLALRIFALAAADADADAVVTAPEVVVVAVEPVRSGPIEHLLAALAASSSFVLRPAVVMTACFVVGIAIGVVFGDVTSTRTASIEVGLFSPIVR